jgi:hypothetical protein
LQPTFLGFSTAHRGRFKHARTACPFAAGVGRISPEVLQRGAVESEELTTPPSALLPIQQPRNEIADCRSGHDPKRNLRRAQIAPQEAVGDPSRDHRHF